MATILNYALGATEPFVARPVSRVDSLCFSCLAYLRFPDDVSVRSREGTSIADLNATSVRSRIVAGTRDVQRWSMLVQAMVLSPRFRDVRACLHTNEVDDAQCMQFSATSFEMPDGTGAFVAFRGTDDTVVGWKENVHLACDEAVPAQRRALAYLEEVASQFDGPLWVGGHSKGGNLAEYACRCASDEIRARIVRCFTHDGPGFAQAMRECDSWNSNVGVDKTIPRESLVGMLHERSQQGLTVVRSSQTGILQHDPFSWEVSGNDFAVEQGMDYDAWRISQRLNDWLDEMSSEQRDGFADLLAWLMDTTAEISFSALLRRWSTNSDAMRAALEAAPAEDRELFQRAMDDLVATMLLGSKAEHGIDQDESPTGRADAAARKMEDLSAHVNDRLAKLERLTGR